MLNDCSTDFDRELSSLSNNGEIRWTQRFDSFERALSQLTQACERTSLDQLERAGLIKNFEICFELSWKVLGAVLSFDGHTENSPRSIFRKSFEVEYIDEGDCETLLRALDNRNLLSYTYRSALADEAELFIKDVYHPVLLKIHKELDTRRI